MQLTEHTRKADVASDLPSDLTLRSSTGLLTHVARDSTILVAHILPLLEPA